MSGFLKVDSRFGLFLYDYILPKSGVTRKKATRFSLHIPYLVEGGELTLHELGITLLQMAFIRTKTIKGKTYYYLVESYRDSKTKRIKQRVLKYLGNQPPEGWQPKKKGDNK